jgi:hypothetical protein
MSQQIADNRTKMTADQVKRLVKNLANVFGGVFYALRENQKRLPQCPGRGCSFVKSLNGSCKPMSIFSNDNHQKSPDIRRSPDLTTHRRKGWRRLPRKSWGKS